MSTLPDTHHARAHDELRDKLVEQANRAWADAPVAWDPGQRDDLGSGLLDAFALPLHVLWVYQEAWSREGFLPLAERRQSIDRLLHQIGYAPSPGSAALGLQHFVCVDGVPGTLPAGFAVRSPKKGEEPDASYETLHPIRLDPVFNELRAFLPAAVADSGSGSGTSGDSGTSSGGADETGADESDHVADAADPAEALTDRLGAGDAADHLAARDAARARARLRRLQDALRDLRDAGVEEDCSAVQELCKALCKEARIAMGDPSPTDGSGLAPPNEAQRIAERQLRRLRKHSTALDDLEAALARQECETDAQYRARLDAMARFLEAFVAEMVQDARDSIAVLRGPRALARLDQAAAPGTSQLGVARAGTDTLYFVTTAEGAVVARQVTGVRPGDWFVLAEDVLRRDAFGKETVERRYREAVRVVEVAVEQPAGVRDSLTKVTFTPKLRRRYRLDDTVVIGNIALCSHGVRIQERLTLEPSARTLPLAKPDPTWLRDPSAPAGRRPEVELEVAGRAWTLVTDLLRSGAGDPHFVVETAPGGGARIRIGDGRNGLRPPPSASLVASYRHGLGTGGNRGVGRVDALVDGHPSVKATLNPVPYVGGTDPEDRAAARAKAPAALRAMDRAVSVADLAALARSFDGVLRASVQAQVSASRQRLSVTVSGEDGSALSEADRSALQAFLQARVPPEARVRVQHRGTLDLRATVRLFLVPGVDPLDTVALVRRALGIDVEDGDPPGLLDPRRVDLGARVHVSDVYRCVAEVEGVSSVVVRPLLVDGRALEQVVAPDTHLVRWADTDPITLNWQFQVDR